MYFHAFHLPFSSSCYALVAPPYKRDMFMLLFPQSTPPLSKSDCSIEFFALPLAPNVRSGMHVVLPCLLPSRPCMQPFDNETCSINDRESVVPTRAGRSRADASYATTKSTAGEQLLPTPQTIFRRHQRLKRVIRTWMDPARKARRGSMTGAQLHRTGRRMLSAVRARVLRPTHCPDSPAPKARPWTLLLATCGICMPPCSRQICCTCSLTWSCELHTNPPCARWVQRWSSVYPHPRRLKGDRELSGIWPCSLILVSRGRENSVAGRP
jgi:hypothetical protein